MKRRRLIAFVGLACFWTGASAFAGGAQEEPSAGKKARVYFYRYSKFTGSARSPSVYCDEAELGRVANGRFLEVEVDSGKRVFRSNSRNSNIEADLKPGQSYYFRLEIVVGGHGKLIPAERDQAVSAMAKLKPIER